MALSNKYLQIRQRFINQFYFEGVISCVLDTTAPGSRIRFGDQTIYMGQALMAFSTEIALLITRNADPSEAKGYIKTILDKIDDLDRKGEKYLDSQATEILDGFFVRDDITGPNDPRLGHRFKQAESDWQHPELENSSPSGDQIFGMMYGLLAVVKYCGDDDLVKHAREISSRLYDYAKRTFFVLTLPNGHPTKRGSDMRWLASLLHGLNRAITDQDLFAASQIKIAGIKLPLNGVASFWSSSTTANTIAQLAGEKLTVPLIGHDIELNSFALHILLMALAPSEIWSQDDLERVALKCNHHLAVLWHCQLHGIEPKGFAEETIRQILDECPPEGPRASLNPNMGWSHDNRWVRCTQIFEHSDGSEEYNGLDWLVLHNLHQLVYLP